MSAIKKYLFETNFDSEAVAPAEEAFVMDGALPAPPRAEAEAAPDPIPMEEEPPPPNFSEQELTAAREEAFAEGMAEGLRRAEENTDRMLGQALSTLAESLRQLAGAREGTEEAALAGTIGITRRILAKLMPELNRRHGLEEIAALLRDQLSQSFEEPRLLVRVHPELLGGAETRLKAVAESAAFRGELRVLAEESLTPGDCRIEWASGGIERSAESIWEQIDAILNRNVTAEEQ